VDPDDVLEEPLVREFLGVEAERLDAQHLLECLPHLGLTFLRDERQHQLDVARLERLQCRLDDRAVQRIAVRRHGLPLSVVGSDQIPSQPRRGPRHS